MAVDHRVATTGQRIAPSAYVLPWRRSIADAGYWVAVLALALGLAAAVLAVFAAEPVPAGGDPGNWAATSLAYLGRPYPSQLTPLAYPPVLFPLLAAAIGITGGTIAGVDAFVAALIVALGLSTASLALGVARSRVVAFAAVGFILIDPATLAMVFWGAYPNLLGFIFANLAFAGLLRAGRGRPSSGAAQFWGFFTLAALAHTLVGVVVGVAVGLFVVLGSFLALPAGPAPLSSARRGTLDSAALAARALWASRGGRAGMVVCAGFIGGYYGLTALAGIPHPYYFTSNPTQFRLSGLGTIFQAIVPNVFLAPSLALAVAAGGALALVATVAVVRDRHPGWLTAPALLLLVWPMAILLLIVGGFVAQVVTDYHRFGFFLVTPGILALAYLTERAWVARTPVAAPAPPPGPATPSGRPRTRLGRPAAFAVVALAIGAIVLVAGTVPALARDEAIFTRVGHDASFLDAVGAIRQHGENGGILTVPGADKWARGLTGDNAFAPSASTAYLFYPAQETDSQLAYFGLETRYAVSNGLVVASVHGVRSGFTEGVPAFSVYVSGMPHELLRLAPESVTVTLVNGSGPAATTSLTTEPAVSLPSGSSGPLTITYTEPAFVLAIAATVVPGRPEVDVGLTATARGPASIASVAVAVEPPVGVPGTVWPAGAPGEFFFTDSGPSPLPVTYGNVSPTTAFRSATSGDPVAGGAAAWIDLAAGGTNGSRIVSGAVTLTAPSVAPTVPGSSAVLTAPDAWAALGVRYILMWNQSATPGASLLFVGEIPYLQGEYGLPVLYANDEWTVLTIPTSGLLGSVAGAG